jgi:tRNA (guanine37-N1)-methyltransferase
MKITKTILKKQRKMIRFDVVTLFPGLFNEFFNTLPFKRALDKDLTQINIWNLRDHALDDYGSVDDKPYGGGKGMILRIEPVYDTLLEIYNDYYSLTPDKYDNKSEITIIDKAKNDPKVKIIALTPKGKTYDQDYASSLKEMEQITLISGRYEGLDGRIIENLASESLSIGNFVLSGGEIPALTVMDSILRLVPGVLEPNVVEQESFENGQLEYPQYTRPENFKGLEVPKVLLSGNHKDIKDWRKKNRKAVNRSE